MHLRLIILALLFLFSERSNAITFHVSPMEISDALPVQFWLVGCATYNEHIADGVHHKCFCAPWECDDVIKVQFTDDPSQNYSLVVFDEDSNEIDSITIEETSVGVYALDYIPSEASPGVCDQKIQLKIRREAGTQGVSLPDFSTWTNAGGAGDPWTTGSSPSFALVGGGNNSEYLISDFAFIVGVEYTVSLNYTSSASNAFSLISVAIMDGSNNLQFTNGVEVIGDTGPHSTVPIVFTATSSTTRVGVRLTVDAFSSLTVTLNSSSATRSIGSEELVAKSDCLHIAQEQEDTILLTYSNHRNFAGLVYDSVSPENEFYIRIPAIFFHQRFPEEDETMELSTSLVTLNGTVRKQRLLDVDYVPYYFHEKLKLILKHQILEIFNRQWVKQEGYEIIEGDRRWPVKKAKCWISEKDFVHRNIL
jgi:hypothetical protein